MTMVEAMGRIQQIQATLQQLRGGPAPVTDAAAATGAATAASATTGTTGSADFAASLASALGGPAASVPPNPGAATGSDVVAAAEKYLGVPYVFGGEDASGMDCSGLVQRVYGDLGIDVPRLVSGQMTIGTEVGSLAEAKPGDLIVTDGGDHILIYAGDHKVIHAPYEGRTVCLVDAYMDDSDIDTIRRVIPDTPAPVPAVTGGTDLLSAALARAVQGTDAKGTAS